MPGPEAAFGAPDPLFATPGGAAPPRVAPIRWYEATVTELRAETARARTIRLSLPEPMDFLAGQHVVVRLTAPDGYRAQRPYSIASAPDPGRPDGATDLEITVERLVDGEVSSFLHGGLQVGDTLTVRGPIGWFAWRADKPALLIGGGSGVVPLMSMLRLARRLGRSDLPRLLVSVRSPADLYYADELPGPEVRVVHTRAVPDGVSRPPHRMDAADLAALRPGEVAEAGGSAYVCGSAGFADTATALLEAAGFPTARVRVERFGPA